MPRLEYRGRRLGSRPGETVLDACLRQGVALPFSCRGGSCHACLCRSDDAVPERARRGLRGDLAAKGYFLPCVCVPEDDLRFEPPRADDLAVRAVLQSREWLSPDVCRVVLEPFAMVEARPGQHIAIRRDAQRIRRYSIANMPAAEGAIELHVRRIPGGAVGEWLCETLAIGDELDLLGPQGDFVHAPSHPDQPLLFVVTGTGLAPALGVIRDALDRGHRGAMHLYHGSRRADGLYLDAALRSLAAAHPTFHYHPCLSSLAQDAGGVRAGRADAVASADLACRADLAGWRVHLAGLPAMVATAAALWRARGVADADLVVDPFDQFDPFEPSSPPPAADATAAQVVEAAPPAGEVPPPAPDPALWAALAQGAKLMPILEEFYGRVFEDPRLSPYFHGSTRQRAIEKVYSFLHQTLTGNKVYFGDRPRNAHHWMTISDELFDYREDLFFAVVRRHGVPEPAIARWRALQARYRPDIVKSAPWPKRLGDVALPLEGFGTMVIDVGSVCDGCAGEIRVGETVRYHLRLGTTYCPSCSDAAPARPAGPAG